MDGLPNSFALDFKRSESGLWFVTCASPINVFIAHQSLEAILADLPNVLRHVGDRLKS